MLLKLTPPTLRVTCLILIPPSFNPDKQSPSNHTQGMVIKNFVPLKLNPKIPK